MNDYITAYSNYRRAQAEANAYNKVVVLDALSAAGITSVTVSFDGAGDSGQIDGIDCEPETDITKIQVTARHAGWNNPALSDRTETLENAVESLCYGYLAFEHGGWEDNDGAFGEFVIDVAARTIDLEFNGRVSSYDTTTHSF